MAKFSLKWNAICSAILDFFVIEKGQWQYVLLSISKKSKKGIFIMHFVRPPSRVQQICASRIITNAKVLLSLSF